MGYYNDLHLAAQGTPGSTARRKQRERQREQEKAEREAQTTEAEEQHEPEEQGNSAGSEEQHESEPFWKRLEPGWWEPHFASGEEAVRALEERGFWTKDEGHGYKVAVNRYHARERKERQEQ